MEEANLPPDASASADPTSPSCDPSLRQKGVKARSLLESKRGPQQQYRKGDRAADQDLQEMKTEKGAEQLTRTCKKRNRSVSALPKVKLQHEFS